MFLIFKIAMVILFVNKDKIDCKNILVIVSKGIIALQLTITVKNAQKVAVVA